MNHQSARQVVDTVLGVPLDDGYPENNRARFGPYAFRAACRASPRSHGVAGARLRAARLYHLAPIGQANPRALFDVKTQLAESFRAGIRPIILGGDESVARTTWKAAAEVYEDVCAIRFRPRREHSAIADQSRPDDAVLTVEFGEDGTLRPAYDAWGLTPSDFEQDCPGVWAARVQAQVGLRPLVLSVSVDGLDDAGLKRIVRRIRGLEFTSLVALEIVDLDPFGTCGDRRLQTVVELAREGLQILQTANPPPTRVNRGTQSAPPASARESLGI